MSIGEDPMQYGVITPGLWAGGDVLAIDESAQSAVPGTLHFFTVSTDPNVQGIGVTGTRDERIRDPVALRGRFVLEGEKVGVYRYGKIRIRIANDLSAMAVGDIGQAAEDTQTIEGETTEVCAVANNMAWEVITTANPTGAEMVALHTDIAEALGHCVEAIGATPGEDKRGKFVMNLSPYRVLTVD
jgi:hypothetical protein